MTDLTYSEVRVEPCVCGGVITADPRDHDAVTITLQRHYAGPIHTAWSQGPLPATPPVDVSRVSADGPTLGPCRCQGCSAMVTWDGWFWNSGMDRHNCLAPRRGMGDNDGVGLAGRVLPHLAPPASPVVAGAPSADTSGPS